MHIFSRCYSEAPKNEYIVDNHTYKKYIRKKRWYLLKRVVKSLFFTMLTIFSTVLYYADIYTDVSLCYKYYEQKELKSFKITLCIIIISLVFNIYVLFDSYSAYFKYKLSRKRYVEVILRLILIITQLEMVYL